MKVTKEKLLSLVKQNIQEMPMDFDGPERPDSDVERDLERGNTPLSIVPTPETGVANQNFLELQKELTKIFSGKYNPTFSALRKSSCLDFSSTIK